LRSNDAPHQSNEGFTSALVPMKVAQLELSASWVPRSTVHSDGQLPEVDALLPVQPPRATEAASTSVTFIMGPQRVMMPMVGSRSQGAVALRSGARESRRFRGPVPGDERQEEIEALFLGELDGVDQRHVDLDACRDPSIAMRSSRSRSQLWAPSRSAQGSHASLHDAARTEEKGRARGQPRRASAVIDMAPER